MRYRLERLRRRGDTATFSSNTSSLRPLPGAAQLVALHRRITDAGALEDGEYLWKQTIRSAGRAAADTDMPSDRGTDAISNPGGRHGEVPGDGAGFHTRIHNALAMLRQGDAGAAPGEPREGFDPT
jgi:hypothetical protein